MTIFDKLGLAHAEVTALCKGKKWQMTIPIDPERDSDTIIGGALREAGIKLMDAKTLLQKIRDNGIHMPNPVNDWELDVQLNTFLEKL